MKSRVSPGNLSVVLFCATAGFLTSVVATFGEEVQHLSIIQPGGMPGLPVMTGIERVGTNDVRITWDGPSGYYQVLSGANLIAGQWQAIGGPNASHRWHRVSSAAVAASQVVLPVVHLVPLVVENGSNRSGEWRLPAPGSHPTALLA